MRTAGMLIIALALQAAPAGAGGYSLRRCSPDAAISGSVCMDAYEASVWRVPNPNFENRWLVKLIQQGTVTEADLLAGGATQQGLHGGDNYGPCLDSGQNCVYDIFAASLPNVYPSTNLTWFQAQTACQNSRKRLPSNAEWQAAVAGSPNPGPDNGLTDCKTTGTAPVPTGSRSTCVSSCGAYDMVGNVYEWVADWVPRSTTCGSWPTSVSPAPSDQQCLAGAATTGDPGVLIRGGNFTSGPLAGPLAILGLYGPSGVSNGVGFRCAR